MKHPIDLYELMAAVYRREDAGLEYPLEALLDVIATEAGHIHRNITDLWDDFFVETAEEWVIPYIADLVGSSPLHKVAGGWRADVARTIYYRRRKGTVEMLERLAADVSGWSARVVEFFELLEWTQYLDHRRITPAAEFGRSDRVGTVNLGNIDALDRLDGPFDIIAHSVDIRPFEGKRGRHGIRKIGFFLWRLQSNPLYAVTPRPCPGNPHGFHFSPLGNAARLFTNKELPSGNTRPEEADLPGPVRRLALHDDFVTAAAVAKQEEATAKAGAVSRYYGPDAHHSMAVAVGDPTGQFAESVLPAHEVTVCDLHDWRRPAAGKKAAIDPVRGRLTLAADAEPGAGETVRVNFNYGFSGGLGGDLGGGPYDRRAFLAPPAQGDFHCVVAAFEPAELSSGSLWRASVREAVTAWLSQPDPSTRALIEIDDGLTYDEGDLTIDLPTGRNLELRAANHQRPVLEVSGLVVQGDVSTRLVIDGLAILGASLQIGPGLAQLTLRNFTLVPGLSFNPDGVVAFPSATSLTSTAEATGCEVTVANGILGPVRLPDEGYSLSITDSIVDSPDGQLAIGGSESDTGYGPACNLERVTVLGDVQVRSVENASEVIFTGVVNIERTQTGCFRFSYVRDELVTPRRYRCQPDLALEGVSEPGQQTRIRSRLEPRFTSRHYGQPGYGQLANDVAIEIAAGAENEAEMGAFNGLLQAQRAANLRLRLHEYLPAGLEAGFIYQT